MPNKENKESNFIIKELLSGNNDVPLKKLYDSYRDDFLAWASKRFTKLNKEDFLDAFQDSLIAFYEKVKSGKIKTLSIDIRTFLFGIGERRIINNLRNNSKIEYTDNLEQYSTKLQEIIQFDWDDLWKIERERLVEFLKINDLTKFRSFLQVKNNNLQKTK
ncbi:MAG: sigma-70 family RNA polymerase sigma factor [Saprospiraceae bacterium]|nr:sigma-70 family RNA polymerase sigma factor [Saprospiraceae bacterium]